MFLSIYEKNRFKYLHEDLLSSGLINNYIDGSKIKKTACFYSKNLNVYIDTSDGVNEDLSIQEYCGRIKWAIKDSNGKKFLFFKSAYSEMWSKNIKMLASKNNGIVIPFFKWSFNNKFYDNVFGKKNKIIEMYKDLKKEYDVGVFFSDKTYSYPRPSQFDNTISWSDHKSFNIEGSSQNTGEYKNESRKKLIQKLNKSNFKVLHDSLPYEDYIKASFQCKTIINPPGIGEYTSRMIDQTYLGNCIVLRKNSYDNAYSWKTWLPEVDFNKNDWEKNLKTVIDNHKFYGELGERYFNQFWSSKAIVEYFKEKINEQLS